LLSGLAQVLFHDRFDTDQGWDLGEQRTGVISLFEERLTFSMRSRSAFLFVLTPLEISPDFYAEVEVSSVLCDPEDEYGLMFRARTFNEHYRFTLRCDGEARVTRILDGRETALIPLTTTNLAFPGVPAQNKLAVRGAGSDFRFYLNDAEIFEARDASLPSGRIGLIVRSRQESQTTIAFDNLLIRGLQPTPTPTPTP
jgi:hypothetical protein